MHGFSSVQTDDIASAEIDMFVDQESQMARLFDCRPTIVLKGGWYVIFNGAYISLHESIYTISFQDHGKTSDHIWR